jgi:F-type H+-transporting ATPase subunit b
MKKFVGLVVLSVAICGNVCFAASQAEAKEGAEAQHEEESPLQAVAKWANFAILFGGLAYLLRKPMGDFFATRGREITGGLQRAQDAQTSAQARMDEIEQRLSKLTSEIAALRAQAEQEALSEKQKIMAEAKRDVERIVEQSRQEIVRVARTVEREIKEHVADLVIDRAGNTLRSEMTQDDQKRIVVRFIERL